jgi:hypothetical protein
MVRLSLPLLRRRPLLFPQLFRRVFEQHKENIASIYQGVKIMHESVAWDQIEEEGMVKGEMVAIVKIRAQTIRRAGCPDPGRLECYPRS